MGLLGHNTTVLLIFVTPHINIKITDFEITAARNHEMQTYIYIKENFGMSHNHIST